MEITNQRANYFIQTKGWSSPLIIGLVAAINAMHFITLFNTFNTFNTYRGKLGYKCGERMWIHGFPLQITSKTPRYIKSTLEDHDISVSVQSGTGNGLSNCIVHQDTLESGISHNKRIKRQIGIFGMDHRSKVVGAWGPQTPVEDIFDVVKMAVEVAEVMRDEKKRSCEMMSVDNRVIRLSLVAFSSFIMAFTAVTSPIMSGFDHPLVWIK
uniref:Uncharacterized protein n=1 Tax=Strigamia maritima TaxID=126957 RepID=T1J1W2_STRMM